MLSVNITDKKWTVLLSEDEWNMIASGLVTNQLMKTSAPIQSGDIIYWCCTDGDMFLAENPHFKPQPETPNNSGIKGMIRHIKTAASVVYRGNDKPETPIKKGWLSIDFVIGETFGVSEEELKQEQPDLQHRLNTDPRSMKIPVDCDGDAEMKVVQTSKDK